MDDIYLGGNRTGIGLRFYPDGVSISGWYDHMVGIEGGFVTWTQLEEWRRKTRRRQPYRPVPKETPL